MMEAIMGTSTHGGVESNAESAILLAGSGSRHLVAAIERELGLSFGACVVDRFPDGEVSVQLGTSVRGRDVIVVGATSPPVNDRLIELLAIADACRRANAQRVVAVIPYFGYARSDRRDGRRSPIMARLAADLIEQRGVAHVMVLDVHTPALEGFFSVAVDHLTAVPLLATAVAKVAPPDAVLVAPDQGAVRLANRYATQLGLPVAICHKERVGAADVRVSRVTGDVRGRACVIVDDMISTGGTVAESARAVLAAGARPRPLVAATHAVFAPGALDRLAAAGIAAVFTTDSIAPSPDPPTSIAPHIVGVASLLAQGIRHVLDGGSIRELDRG